MARFPSQKCEETNQEYALIDWEKFSELVSRRPMIKQLRDRSWVSDVVRRIQHIYLPFVGSVTTSILLVLLILQYLYFLWCIIILHPWPETYLRNKGQSHYCLLSNLMYWMKYCFNNISYTLANPFFYHFFSYKRYRVFCSSPFLHFLWVLLDAKFTESLDTPRRH